MLGQKCSNTCKIYYIYFYIFVCRSKLYAKGQAHSSPKCSLVFLDLAGLVKLTVGYGKDLLHFQVSGHLSQTHGSSVNRAESKVEIEPPNQPTSCHSSQGHTTGNKKVAFKFFFKIYGTLQESTFASPMESSVNHAFTFWKKKKKVDYASSSTVK